MNYSTDYLAHFGIKGMKWGIRRFMNEDGTLTEEGKRRYGYTDTGTGGNRKESIRNRLFGSSNKNKPASDRVASLPQDAAESVSKSKKPKKVSQMTDQELRDRINRMQMEKQYKQLEAESSGKVKSNNQNNQNNVQSFAQKHPIMKQIFMDTATRTLSSLVSQQMNTKMDEMLAEKRMERAKEKGMLDQRLFPFVSKETAARISSYNKGKEATEKAEADIKKKVEDARAEAKKEALKYQEQNLASAVEAARRAMKSDYEANLAEAARKGKEAGRKEELLNQQRNLMSAANTIRQKLGQENVNKINTVFDNFRKKKIKGNKNNKRNRGYESVLSELYQELMKG